MSKPSISGGSVNLKELSKRFRHTLSDPNYVCPPLSTSGLPGGSSLLELRGLARRFGLKFNALRGRAVYLSTEAYYLEVKDSGEARLHVLSPESIEVLPPGEDLLGHLKGLMELRPQDWSELATLQEDLQKLIGDDLIPRLGGTPAQIRFSSEYPPLEIKPHKDHYVLRLKEAFPLANEALGALEKVISGGTTLGTTGPQRSLLRLLSSESSTLSISLPDQRHRYYLCPTLPGLHLTSIPFHRPSQIPEILSILRRQALFNALITSCGSPNVNLSRSQQPDDDSEEDSDEISVFELSSLSLCQISVGFEHPDTEGIHALEIQIPSLSTRLYSSNGDEALMDTGDLNDRVLEAVRSIPQLMRLILKTSRGSAGVNSSSISDKRVDAFYPRDASDVVADSTGGSQEFGSSFQVDPLNAQRPQEVACIPGAKSKAHPQAAAAAAVVVPTQPPRQTKTSHPSTSTKRKISEETTLPVKPVVSITPVSSDSGDLRGTSSSSSSSKIGIEIIPLGSSASPKSSSPRDIKRSLSEDDKRNSSSSSKKDKKRRHPSPLSSSNRGSSSSSSGSIISGKKTKSSSSPESSLKVTLKNNSSSSGGKSSSITKYPSTSSSSSSSKSPTKYSSGSGSGSSGSSSSSSSNRSKSRDKEDEVKRLLAGGKLLNKTFQIPKLSTGTNSGGNSGSGSTGNESDKKSSSRDIPSLMSLQPSLYGAGKDQSSSSKGHHSCPPSPNASPSRRTSGGSHQRRGGSPSKGDLTGIEHLS